MSKRPGLSQKRFSRDRFQQIPDSGSAAMANPNDATIDIPLTTVPSRNTTGARKIDTITSPSGYVGSPEANEKSPFQPGGFRRKGGDGEDLRTNEDPEDGTLNRMGRIYNAILNFSVVTRYFLYVLPLAIVFAIPLIIGATAAPNADIGGVRIVWFFLWVEIVWFSLWVSKIVAQFLPFAFQFLCGIVSSGTRKYALILKALEIPLSLIGWSVTSLATFIPLMTRNPTQRANGDTKIKSWESVVNNILFAAFASSLVFGAEKLLVQLISISYHRKQFDERIKESKHNIYLVGQLYDASRAMFPEYCREFAAEDYVISDSLVKVKKGGHTRSGSAAPMRLIQNVGQNMGRVGDKITAAFGNVAHEITGKQVFNPTSAHSIVVEALERRKSSEALARRLWMSFVIEGKDALYVEDIVEVLGAERQMEAEECFHMLDRDGNGDISLEEMILTIIEFGRVRESIANSMHDVDQAIHVLDNLLSVIVFILVIMIFLAFLNSGFGTTLAAGATALLSLSFVFAATCQEVLGSCIFLFVKHPFDVGDRVDIEDRPLVVERISLLFTVFKGVDDHRTQQVPNIVLNGVWIENITRSKAMRERIELPVDFGTSFQDIQLLRGEMQQFVLDKDNCRDFQPDIDIEVLDLGSMDKLTLRIEIRHKSNWSNETIRAARRSKFMCALVLAVRKVPINGPGGGGAALGSADSPSYSVAISEEMAQHNKEKFADAQEAARMVPSKPATEDKAKSSGVDVGNSAEAQYRGASATTSEATVVEALNHRPVAMDQGRIDESDLYRRTSTASAGPYLAANDQANLSRTVSTGRRKADGQPTLTVPTAQQSSSSNYHDYTYGQQAPSQPVSQQSSQQSSQPLNNNNPYQVYSPTEEEEEEGRRRLVGGNAFAQQQQSYSQQPPY